MATSTTSAATGKLFDSSFTSTTVATSPPPFFFFSIDLMVWLVWIFIPCLREDPLRELGDVAILDGQDPLEHLHDGHLGAEGLL